MINFHVSSNAGHPWDGRPGFDILEFECDAQAEDTFRAAAERKFWQAWLIGFGANGKHGGAFYKPSGIKNEWKDSPQAPHPGCRRHA